MKNVNKPSTSIKNWAIDERPREKMIANGAETLSLSEILAILISTGSRNKSAVELAREVLLLGQNNLNELGLLVTFLQIAVLTTKKRICYRS